LSPGAGADSVQVWSNASTLDGIAALLTINAATSGTDEDRLEIRDTGNAPGRRGAQAGTLTQDSLNGLGMAGGISYSAVERFELYLGSGADELTIASTHAAATVVDAGGGADVVNVQSIAGGTIVSGGAG